MKTKNDPLIELVRKMVAENPKIGRVAIAAKLGIKPNGTLRRVVELVKAGKPVERDVKLTQAEPTESREFAGNTAELSTLKYGIRTLDQLLAYMQVDLTVWEVERHVINKWEVGGKPGDKNNLVANTDTGFAVEPLFQVKAWLRRKVEEVRAKNLFADMLAEFKKQAPTVKQSIRPKASGAPCLFEVDIFDPHFGKLCWGKESGRDYDLKIAAVEYGRAVEGLIARAAGHRIERILYPIGNDFFHTDQGNATTAGTEQDCDGRWQKSFVAGRVAVLQSIMRLREIAPVDILMIPGNHDTQKVFYLGEVLSGYLSKTSGVAVNNSPNLRKYYRYGANLIGLTHGNNEKHSDLPLIMATETGADWSATKFREFHIGHHHKLKTISFLPSQEYNSIRVRTLSSLTPPDAWHKKMGYEGLRAANAFIWDKRDGCVAALSFNA